MTRLLFISTVLIVLLVADTASACSVPKRPFESEFDHYREVYIGEVVGVNLTAYERERVKEIESGSNEHSWLYWGGATLEHEVDVLVTKRLKGEPPSRLTLKVSGCGVPVATPGEEGIFFVPELGGVIPVYYSQRFWFTEWVNKASEHFRPGGRGKR